MHSQLNRSRSADAVSAGLSSLCLMHCLVLPAIVSLSPVLGVLSAEWVHQALVVIAVPVSLSVLTKTTRGLSRNITACLIIAGLSCLFAGGFIEPLHDYEKALTIIGGVTLALTHAFRWWMHKRLSYPPEDHF